MDTIASLPILECRRGSRDGPVAADRRTDHGRCIIAFVGLGSPQLARMDLDEESQVMAIPW